MFPQAVFLDKKKEADKLVRRYAIFSAGAGWIPIPLIDSAAIGSIQLIMIKQLANLYETPFKDHLATSLSAAFLASVGTVSGFKFLPGVGKIIGGVTVSSIGGASTYALGKVFTQHFDQGGTLFDFDPEKSRAYFEQELEKGKSYVLGIKNETQGDTLKQLVAASQENRAILDKLQEEANQLVEKQAMRGTKKIDVVSTDLKVIDGIGPKIEAALNASGIHNWHQLSNTKPTVIQGVLEEAEGNFRLADPESWPEQATLAAAGKLKELAVLQKKLKDKKYSDKKHAKSN